MRLESSISWNKGKFLRVGSFYFLSWDSCLLKYKKFFWILISWNIRKSLFLKYKKVPFPEIKKHFCKKIRIFLFFELGLSQVAIFAKRFILVVWQCSECTSSSEYTRVLILLLVLNMLGLWMYLSWNIRKFDCVRVLNIPFPKYKTVLLC